MGVRICQDGKGYHFGQEYVSLIIGISDRDGVVDLPYKPFQAPDAHVADYSKPVEVVQIIWDSMGFRSIL